MEIRRTRRLRSPNNTQRETTGVGEQSYTRDDDRREIFGAAPPVVSQAGGAGDEPYSNTGSQSNTPFTVGTTSIRVLPANRRRVYLIIQNKSADVMYVNFGQLADIYNGIQISAGGAYEWIGGARGGSFVPNDDIYVLGGSADLAGVISEGME